MQQNMMDYLDWRGDLSFEASPFNEVDNLILAWLSYVDYDQIVPAEGKGEITIAEAALRFFQIHSQEELDADRSFVRKAPSLLRSAATTRRFSGVLLRNYVSRLDEDEALQFSVVELVLPGVGSYVSFRGTDDTIVGWKEDFRLSIGIVPAQREAAAYLDRIVPFDGEETRPGALYIGGHSKGGNLSEYAAAMCRRDIQDRITKIFNNDGPGFAPAFIRREEYQRIVSRVVFIVPSYSIIGKLLDHGVKESVVLSSEKSVMAHDAFTWQVLGPRFVKADKIEDTAKVFNDAVRNWIDGLDGPGRESFIEDFFGVLEATGARTLTELQEGGFSNVRAMLGSLDKVEPENRAKVLQLVAGLLSDLGGFLLDAISKGNLLDVIPKGNLLDAIPKGNLLEQYLGSGDR